VRAQASTIIAPVYQRFIEEGYDVIVSHPRKARYIAEAARAPPRRSITGIMFFSSSGYRKTLWRFLCAHAPFL
jgi:hypothetical protein